MAFEYRKGPKTLTKLPLDGDTAAIVPGRAITLTDATDGYFKGADASGEALSGIAHQTVASPSSDGDAFVLAYTDPSTIFEVPPDAGTVTQALAGNTCDVGADGLSINIDASSTDDILILEVDTVANTCLVRCLFNSHTGVA
jgi:hypothetical protein